MTHVYAAITLTPTEQHQYVMCHGTAAFTITLYAVSGNGGKRMTIINDSTAEITLTRAGADTIQGSLTSIYLVTNGDFVSHVSDGTADWWSCGDGLWSAATGETPLGRPHDDPVDLLSTDPANTNWTALDVGGPVTARAIFARVEMSTTATGHEAQLSKASAGSVYVEVVSDADGRGRGSGIVPVDANGDIWWAVSTALVSNLTIVKLAWYGPG